MHILFFFRGSCHIFFFFFFMSRTGVDRWSNMKTAMIPGLRSTRRNSYGSTTSAKEDGNIAKVSRNHIIVGRTGKKKKKGPGIYLYLSFGFVGRRGYGSFVGTFSSSSDTRWPPWLPELPPVTPADLSTDWAGSPKSLIETLNESRRSGCRN